MLNSVKKAIEQYRMLDSVKCVTVALSGGADSVALLLALLELKSQYGYNLTAAHLNHCLRGVESDSDELFVRKLCSELGVQLFCERADVLKAAQESKESIELTARKIRYDFLNRVADGVIATAHTVNDNAETIVYNMSRGTGIDGLCGIPPVRDNIIRPLIFAERTQIEDYCAQNGIDFVTDSSNLSDDYARNKIRHNVIPTMVEVNSGAIKNIGGMSEVLKQDAQFLEQTAKIAFANCKIENGLNVDKLLKLHPAIRNRCIIKLYEQIVGVAPDRLHITLICDMLENNKTCQSVQKDYFAKMQKGVLFFEKEKKSTKLPEFSIGDTFPIVLNGVEICKKTIENVKNIPNFNNLLLKSAIDYDKICGKLVIRGRKDGDSIKLSKKGCTKTFKKLFNENSIDVAMRDKLPVIADEKGVVWLCSFGVDERVAVDSNTKNILVLKVSENTDVKGI